ncbi:MAG: TolC family protein [Armatimonadetes bacterium]|nr:TolC family protein [Candidatus Hippobium faecium]
MKYLFLLMSLFLIAGAVYCQDVKEYNLSDCISLAIDHNSDLKTAANRIISSKAGTEMALSDYYPKVTANNQTFETKMHNNSNFEKGTSISANLKLFDTGLRYLTVKGAKESEKQTYYDVFRTYQTVIYNVMRDYYNCQRYRELIALKENSVAYYTQQLNEYKDKIEIGDKAPVDIYPIQASLADSKVTLLSAKNAYEDSKRDLFNLLGMKETEEYNFAFESVEVGDEELIADSIAETAFRNRTDLMAQNYAVKNAKTNKQKADMDLWPIFYINAEFENDFTNTFADTDKHSDGRIMGYISWNLFDGFNTQAKIKQSKANLLNSEESRDKLERDIVTNLKNLFSDISITREQLEASRLGFDSAEKNRDVQTEKFNLDMNTNLDILNAQVQYDTAMANLINCRYDLKLCYIELDYQTGILGLDNEKVVLANEKVAKELNSANAEENK